jgi:hypothetical protein
MRFELKTLVVIDTDCIGSCKSNCHTVMTMTAPMCVVIGATFNYDLIKLENCS